jgi:hypothetical protein
MADTDTDNIYGLNQDQRNAMMFNSLTNLGGLLMAAGQKQMPSERAKYLAQIGNVPGEMAKQMDVMQQAQLRNAQMMKLREEMNQLKAWRTLMGANPGANSASAVPSIPPAAASSASGIAAAAPAVPTAPAAPAAPANGVVMPPAVAGGVSPIPGVTLTMPSAAGGGAGPTTGPTLNSSLIPNIISRMDPQSRLMLGTLGPQVGAQTLLKESFDTAARNQQIEAEKQRQERGLETDVVKLPVMGPDGVTREISVQKSQVPQTLADLQKQGMTVGKPEYNPEQTEQLKGFGELYNNLQGSRRDAADLNGRLSQLEAAAAGFTPGKGANRFYDAAAWLNGYLPGGFIPEGMSADKVSSFQEFSKLATQYATERARTLGAREAASVVQMMVNANPNAEMTPDAIKRIVAGLRAQNDYSVEKANAADAWLADPANKGSLRGFENDFIKKNSPEKFLLPYLTQEDLKTIPAPVLKKMMGQ